jgi:hypothetical protein
LVACKLLSRVVTIQTIRCGYSNEESSNKVPDFDALFGSLARVSSSIISCWVHAVMCKHNEMCGHTLYIVTQLQGPSPGQPQYTQQLAR